MRVIITGGTGLIGTALTQDLIRDRHEVIVLSRNPGRAQGLPDSVQVEQWDARTAAGWGRLVNGADAVINLAGAGVADSRWTEARKRLIRDSRLNAGQAVMQAIERADVKPRVLIQSSAVGYYGPGGDEAITEDDPPHDDFLARVCVDWEASTQGAEALGVRRAVVRTGVVLASSGGALPRMLLPFKLFIGGPLGSGKQWFPWIHLADEVAAIRFLLENKAASGPFNLVAPNPLTNAQFSRTLGKVMGRPSLMPVPGLALKMLFGEMAAVLLEGQRAAPKALLDLGFSFRFSTAEEALQDLLST